MSPASLVGASQGALAARLRGGARLDPALLDGWVYRGISLGLPRWLERVTWTKFAKAFTREPGGARRGWNIRCEQDALDRPWRARRGGGGPDGAEVTFGPFVVVDGPGGVVLDYGVPGASLALRTLRDPLVAIGDSGGEAGGPVVLGRSLVVVGGRTLGTPSYFVLERDRPV